MTAHRKLTEIELPRSFREGKQGYICQLFTSNCIPHPAYIL